MNEQSIVDALLANNIPAEVVYTGGGLYYAEVINPEQPGLYLSVLCNEGEQFTGNGNETAVLQICSSDGAIFDGEPQQIISVNLTTEDEVMRTVRANLHRIGIDRTCCERPYIWRGMDGNYYCEKCDTPCVCCSTAE